MKKSNPKAWRRRFVDWRALLRGGAKQKRKLGLAVSLFFLLLTLVTVPLALHLVRQRQEIRKEAAPTAVLSLTPATRTVSVEEVFNVQIYLGTGGNAIRGGDISLNFNPAHLEVLDADSSKPGVQVSPGTILTDPWVAVNQTDNDKGKILLSINTFSSFTGGEGVFGTVQFRTKALASSTEVSFNPDPETKITAVGGESVAATKRSATYRIESQPTPTPTSAPTPISGRIILEREGEVFVKVVSQDTACRPVPLSLTSPRQQFLLNVNNNPGAEALVGNYTAGTEPIFYYDAEASPCGSGAFSSSSTDSRYWRIDHPSSTVWIAGIEDTRGGGDQDYNDTVLRIEQFTIAPGPGYPLCSTGELLANPELNGTNGWYFWNVGNTTGWGSGGKLILQTSGSGSGGWTQNVTTNLRNKRVRLSGSLAKSVAMTDDPYLSINAHKDDGSVVNNYGGPLFSGSSVGVFEAVSKEIDIGPDVAWIEVGFPIWSAPASTSYADWISLCVDNLVLNSGFENGAANWAFWSEGTQLYQGMVVSGGYQSDRAYRITTGTDQPNNWGRAACVNQGFFVSNPIFEKPAVFAGQTLKLSGYIKTSASTTNGHLKVNLTTPTGGRNSYWVPGVTGNINLQDWQPIEKIMVIPNDATKIEVDGCSAGAAGGQAWFDELRLVLIPPIRP